MNKGGGFLINDSKSVLKQSQVPLMEINLPILKLDDHILLNHSLCDGVVLIEDESIIAGGVIVRPKENTPIEFIGDALNKASGMGLGSRHASLIRMTGETDSTAVIISQEGDISIANNGKVYMIIG